MKDLMVNTILVAVFKSTETHIQIHSQLISEIAHSQLTDDTHRL